jgi:short-subunit dehydrogenase
MSDSGRVLVTGASAGIGAELARVFATNGHDLVLVARNQRRLDALAAELRREGRAVSVIRQDLAQPGAAAALYRKIEARKLRIDVLVNNAGVLYAGRFDEMPEQTLDQIVQLNIGALAGLCRLIGAGMTQRGSGRILNVASAAGFQPIATMAAYAASKAFVLSLSEALAAEFADKGVTVTAVCPGFTDTAMLRQVDRLHGIEEFPRFLVSSRESVAQEAYRACIDGEPVWVPGLGYRVMTQLTSRLPRWLRRRIDMEVARRLLR